MFLRDIHEEFHHLIEWSSENELAINNNKTKEIIFFKTKNIATKYAIQPITDIEQASNVKTPRHPPGPLFVLVTPYQQRFNHDSSALLFIE